MNLTLEQEHKLNKMNRISQDIQLGSRLKNQSYFPLKIGEDSGRFINTGESGFYEYMLDIDADIIPSYSNLYYINAPLFKVCSAIVEDRIYNDISYKRIENDGIFGYCGYRIISYYEKISPDVVDIVDNKYTYYLTKCNGVTLHDKMGVTSENSFSSVTMLYGFG